MDIENTKRSQVKIQKTAGVEQCFPGWVSNLDGRSTHDGATCAATSLPGSRHSGFGLEWR
jgi:hypothetical protein